MNNSINKILLFFLFTVFFLYTSFFTIPEGQVGIVLRFDKVVRNVGNLPIIYNPGLHVKIPFIEKIKILDSRIQTTENQADRFVTMEKKDLIVDSYIKWKISDFKKYYLATGGGDISQAEILLKRKFYDRLRSELGKLNVRDIVTDSRNRLMTDVRDVLNFGSVLETNNSFFQKKSNKKGINDVISQEIFPNRNNMQDLGIEIVDVRIKQINLPSEVSDAIYQRMRAEREAVARKHRSQGREAAEKLRAIADYQVTKTLSEAKRQSLILKGEADAQTIKIYADAFGKDPKFYSFVRSIRAFENSFSKKNNFIVLDPESDFFHFIRLYN